MWDPNKPADNGVVAIKSIYMTEIALIIRTIMRINIFKLHVHISSKIANKQVVIVQSNNVKGQCEPNNLSQTKGI